MDHQWADWSLFGRRSHLRGLDAPSADAIDELKRIQVHVVAKLEKMERDLGKPVVSAAAAMMWNALVVAGVSATISGFGSLLNEKRSKP